MKETGTRTKYRLPVWAGTAITVALTMAATLGLLLLLLGREGMALMEGWLLAKYVFVEEDADLGQASDVALAGLVAGLGDRWSYYIDPDSYQALVDRRANRYVGVGLTVDYTDERGLHVQAVNAGSPAEEAGVEVDDIIIAVDGVSVAGEAQRGGADLIGGEEGTRQVLTLLDSAGEERDVTVTLRYLSSPVVTGQLLDNQMGLVTIRNFNTNANKEFRETVNDLMDQGARALIFDLRNDGGGYIKELTQMLDFVLPAGAVFQSEPRWGFSSVVKADGNYVSLPFGALVNAGSYSAAELFAAQLRETLGTPIVGELTSGKGYSQNTFRLPNGGAIGISTARYRTGGGVSLIGVGITPDIAVDLNEEQAARLRAGTLALEDDPQLQALIELMEG